MSENEIENGPVPDPMPARVFRIITAVDWEVTQQTGLVPWGDIDHRDGYLHLSTRQQTLETAALHFAGATDLLVLEFMSKDLRDTLRFEVVASRGGALFPHQYGPLSLAAVQQVWQLVSEDGVFDFAEPVT